MAWAAVKLFSHGTMKRILSSEAASRAWKVSRLLKWNLFMRVGMPAAFDILVSIGLLRFYHRKICFPKIILGEILGNYVYLYIQTYIYHIYLFIVLHIINTYIFKSHLIKWVFGTLKKNDIRYASCYVDIYLFYYLCDYIFSLVIYSFLCISLQWMILHLYIFSTFPRDQIFPVFVHILVQTRKHNQCRLLCPFI